ncbi:MAG: hypothetical protein R8K22_05005 [Mariprofundaceae bacterium]
MDIFRAKIITDRLSQAGTFGVKQKTCGIIVKRLGHKAYFENEHDLWPFLFHVAQAGHEESLVAEIEAELRA